MSVPVPTSETRWRCSLCGNLTRFDVTRTTRARDFMHLDLAGDSTVEDREVLSDTIEEVRCLWCNQHNTVELVARADSAGGVSDLSRRGGQAMS